MRALVIAPQPFFTPRGTPFSVYYRTLITAEQGVEVDLLTYGEGRDVVIPGVRIIRIPRFARLGHVKIGPSMLKLFLDVFLVLWTLGLLMRNRYDFVHAHEEAIFYCRFLKPLFGFKLVYDMHSSLPQQLTNFRFTTSKLLIGSFAWLENSCLRASDAVITICPDLRDQVDELLSEPERAKHFLIENSIFDPVRFADTGETKTETDTEVPPAPPAGRRCIVYAGTLEPYQGIDLLVKSFRKVVAEKPDAFLLIVGGTPDQVALYSELAHEQGVAEHCLFTGRVLPDAARACAAAADVLVSPRIDGTNTPLKVYEQLASGIPLVATNIYSHTQVLSDSVCFLASPDENDFGRALSLALEDGPERESRVREARGLYERAYSREAYVGKMRRLLERLA